jgi:hypothetical protein
MHPSNLGLALPALFFLVFWPLIGPVGGLLSAVAQPWGDVEASDWGLEIYAAPECEIHGGAVTGHRRGRLMTERTAQSHGALGCFGDWGEWLPDGLIYRSYLAGVKEPRIAGTFQQQKHQGLFLDATLGGRVGLIRFDPGGSRDRWAAQLDVEGAAFPRVDLDREWDLDSSDFRIGFAWTEGDEILQTKFAFYHLSSHLGDELILFDPTTATERINYSRDTLVAGVSYFLRPFWRWYAEIGWAPATDGGSEPWEVQFGTELSPLTPVDQHGSPFLAVGAHLREEVDFGGQFVLQTGWQLTGETGRRFRVGLHYLNGMSSELQFFRQSEQQIGLGLWYDY